MMHGKLLTRCIEIKVYGICIGWCGTSSRCKKDTETGRRETSNVVRTTTYMFDATHNTESAFNSLQHYNSITRSFGWGKEIIIVFTCLLPLCTYFGFSQRQLTNINNSNMYLDVFGSIHNGFIGLKCR